MRRLSPRVNVIPVIGKADSLTPSELKSFKKRVRTVPTCIVRILLFTPLQIMEDIEHYDIPVYNFPYDVEEDDEETIIDNSELRVSLIGVWIDTELILLTRLCCHLPLLALRRRSKSMESLFVLAFTPGALPRLITPSTRTLADFVLLS